MKRENLSLYWLIRLRWIAVLGQALTIAVAVKVMHMELPLLPLALILATAAFTNLIIGKRSVENGTDATLISAGLLLLDTLLLTALLYFTGGPSNPFSILFLVHVALASVMLPRPWAWMLAGLSVVAFGALFPYHLPLAAFHHGHEDFSLHLKGMWIAFAIAAGLIAYLIGGLFTALQKREMELAENERLVGLATLAAGAAHELSTPLATIAVVAKDLANTPSAAIDDTREDLLLIRREVERCRKIIEQMAAPKLEGASQLSVAECFSRLRTHLGETEAARVVFQNETALESVSSEPQALERILLNLLRNALGASPAARQVFLKFRKETDHLQFIVEDQGEGMKEFVRQHAFEPFFTTKEPGEGMGLGLFLSRLLTERLGGRLHLHSELGRGTRAILEIPCA